MLSLSTPGIYNQLFNAVTVALRGSILDSRCSPKEGNVERSKGTPDTRLYETLIETAKTDHNSIQKVLK